GLHFDDIAKLMTALRSLMQAGHTVVVIEHNVDVIQAADWVLEIGPKGGHQGGYLIAECSPQALQLQDTPTGRALQEYQDELVGTQVQAKTAVPVLAEPQMARYGSDAQAIQIINAREHNLKNMQVTIPRDQ